MLLTSRTVTTNPFALMCFTQRPQHSQPGSLYTVRTSGGAANTARRAASMAAADAMKWRREIMIAIYGGSSMDCHYRHGAALGMTGKCRQVNSGKHARL